MAQLDSDHSLQAILQLGIPDYVPQVLELFQGTLAEVEFPGINREVLNELVQRVESKSRDLERLQLQFDELQKELESNKILLTEAARRGLAYAQVYGESDNKVAEAIREIRIEEPRKVQNRSRTRTSRKKQAKSDSSTDSPTRVGSGGGEGKAKDVTVDALPVELALQPSLSA